MSVPVGSARLPWDAVVDDPVGAIAADRAALGDTFVIDSGGMRYLFVFSAEGVRAFYDIDEAIASKGIADMRMLARKVPADLFYDRRTIPHDMFTRDLAAAYLDQVAAALETELALLVETGEVEIFEFARQLGHRFGLSSWGGPGASEGVVFGRLVAALDVLDASAAFVNPEAAAEIAANNHAVERAALAEIEAVYESVVAAHDADPKPGMFATIASRWDGREARVRGIARDAALVHIGSMSNLFAAVGWSIVHLAGRPELVARVQAGDRDLAERCALESIRIAQRSIMLREVLQSTSVSIDGVEHELAVGDTLATLLPLTNTEAPGYEVFDPDRWKGRRLGDVADLAARELVTGFGHGRHTCPAQPFSLRVMVDTLVALTTEFELTLADSNPQPRVGQIGGVARSERACLLRYARRTAT
ncbi:MAG: cytochrome P450 [Candidatus Aldehydirespiratoraceae bacterium]|jgi:cytochrome P450